MIQPFIAIDQLLNTMVWIKGDGFGYADEMLSARAWRLRKISKLQVWIDRLFFWDDQHCYECWRIEVERKQMPVEYRMS